MVALENFRPGPGGVEGVGRNGYVIALPTHNQGPFMAEVELDRSSCWGCRNCVGACGRLFDTGTGSKSRLREEYSDGDPGRGEVPDDLVNCAIEAALDCSRNAITVK